jgi:nucleotide-binding universal stress UspA family protein
MANGSQGDRDGSAPGGVIVVGVDGSTHSREALRWAIEEAAIRGARVRAVLTWSMPYAFVGLEAAVAIPAESFERNAREQLAAIVAETVPDAAQRAQVEQVLHAGNPVPELLDEARGAALLVVGARGAGGFLGLLLGSTADQLTKHATCPVVVVRTRASAA